MSGKSAKKIRRSIRKLNKEVFKEHIIEISVMPFWPRLAYCLNMAFNRHGLQKGLKAEIQARRTHNRDGEVKGNVTKDND